MKLKRMVSSLSLMLMLFAATIVPASAHNYYDYRDNRYYDNNRFGSYMDRHPYIKKAAIGGGAGAAIGALVARDGSRVNGAVKGALIGAGAGLGYEYLRRKGVFSW
jgi:outer membrane lipoprotein SlyB